MAERYTKIRIGKPEGAVRAAEPACKREAVKQVQQVPMGATQMPIVQDNVLEYEGEVYVRPVGRGIILGGRDELDAAPDLLEEIYGLIGGDNCFVRLRIRVERLP